MNSTFLWIAFPFVAGLILLLLNPYRRISFYLGAVISFVLAIAAVILPIDQAITIGPLSVKIASTFSILGRNLVIAQADRTLLMLLFAITAFWLIGGAGYSFIQPVTICIIAYDIPVDCIAGSKTVLVCCNIN